MKWAFVLYNQEHGVLFSVGGGPDICIMKEDHYDKCSCVQHSFDYKGKQNVFTGKEKFEVKRIRVWQMKETLKDDIYYRNEIEKISEKKYIETIFDSDKDNWKQKSSIFNIKLKEKEKLMVVIYGFGNNVFGIFINEKINEENVSDSNAFICSITSNGRLPKPMKFNIKRKCKTEALKIYPKESKFLFTIGNNDVCIMKQEYSQRCYCVQSSFDYEGNKHVLVGKENEENPFTVKRIQVWQME